MNNILLNKARNSFLLSTLLSNFIIIIIGTDTVTNDTTIILIIFLLYIVLFIAFNTFYNPYKFVFFGTDDNISNIYFYFFIIDHLKNKSFLLEESLQKHYSICKNCNFCLNLKLYLSNELNHKHLYKILYKDISKASKIMNELIHTLLVYDKEYLRNNSYYLINILYCYYIHYNNKEYILSSNLKLIYEILNEENKNILENHSLSTEQIFLINEFLDRVEIILNQLKETVISGAFQRKIIKFFSLLDSIFILKEKKFRTKLYYNKNEGIFNFVRYISICTMIYEELFNTTLSYGGISLKENQLFLDELSNNNNRELNQIIIQLNLLKFENKIIYAVGEFAKYKNYTLCKLFPNIFRNKQVLMIKKKILNSKYYKTIENDDFFKNSKDIDGKLINFKFVIYDNEEKKKKFKIIDLKLSLFYSLEMTKQILLGGIYSIEKNVIITLDKSNKDIKKEYILNLEQKDNEDKYNSTINNNNFIKFKKNEKYYNNQKLVFIIKYIINSNIYNIYYIFHSEKQNTVKEDLQFNSKNSLKNNNDKDSKIKIDISDGNKNFNFLIQSTSASASTFIQISNDKQNFKKRNKSSKKENKKKKNFQYFQIILVIFSFIIIISQIASHISIAKYNNYVYYQNSALTALKNYYSLYNALFTSILSIVCLAKKSKGNECFSVIGLFENYYNNRAQKNTLNITEFILNQTKFKSIQLSAVKKQILGILTVSENEELLELINSNLLMFYITQNITKNDIKLNFYLSNNSFLDVLDYMCTGFLIMTSKYEYLNDIVYIVNKIEANKPNNDPFIHVSIKTQLSQYQNYFYIFVLNYVTFIRKLDLITAQIIFQNEKLFLKSIHLCYIFIGINLFLYLFMHLLIYFYIHKYYYLITDLIEEMHSKMNLKNDNISVREMFLEKIEKLKVIISLYKQDIYQAIVDLNFIYDNYKKFIDEKNKAMAKYLKKEKYLNDNESIKTLNLKKSKLKMIKNVPENKRHLYYILITLIFSIALSIGILIMFISYHSVYNRLNDLIKAHGNMSNDIYRLINYYQLMVFRNFTIEDINEFENYEKSGRDLFSNMYIDIEQIYNAKKLMNKLKHYNLANIDSYYNFTCETYYDYLFKSNNAFININEAYKYFLTVTCEDTKIFRSNNYKLIFSILLEYIQIGINEITNQTYDGLTDIMHGNNFPIIIVAYLTVYNYALEILGFQLQKNSYQKITSLIENYINISFSIYYVNSFTLVLIIIFGYILNINSIYNKIHELKKVFKICNKKE